MFKHCALVRILAPETLLDADESLLLGVALGTYCTRYLDMYFSSLAGSPLVGDGLVDDGVDEGVREEVDDGVEIMERRQVDLGVELHVGTLSVGFTLAAAVSGDEVV